MLGNKKEEVKKRMKIGALNYGTELELILFLAILIN